MHSRYQRRVLDHLKHDDYTPRRIGELATDLNIPGEELEAFTAAIRRLEDDKTLEVSQGGVVSLPSVASRGGTITGVFRKNARGFGFVQPSDAVREGAIF